jgi:hypothetical protein
MASKGETWRKLAAEALVAAHTTTDPEAKRVLTLIALTYGRLARQAEERDKPEEPKE